MANTSANDISNQEVLEAVQTGFLHMEERFQALDNRLSGRIDELDTRLTGRIDDLTTTVDGLAKRHLDFDEALAMERSTRERLETRVSTLENS